MIDYLLTFALAVASVGLWTLRVALTARGLRVAGSLVAMLEAVVFVLAFSHVLGSLETPGRVVVYGLGVGTGTFAGLTLDSLIKREGPQKAPRSNQWKETKKRYEPQTQTAHSTPTNP